MKLSALELRRIRMPLVAPFRTSFGTETERDVLLIRAITPDAESRSPVRTRCTPRSTWTLRTTSFAAT